jgi:hypothetical protein
VTPGQRRHRRLRLVAHPVLHRAGRRRQLDRERHPAAVDRQILDEAQRDDVLCRSGSNGSRLIIPGVSEYANRF